MREIPRDFGDLVEDYEERIKYTVQMSFLEWISEMIEKSKQQYDPITFLQGMVDTSTELIRQSYEDKRKSRDTKTED